MASAAQRGVLGERCGQWFLTAIAACLLTVSPLWSQRRGLIEPPGPTRLSPDVFLDEIVNEAAADLQRAEEFLQNKQWEDGIETVRRVMANHGDKVIRITSPLDNQQFAHYVRVREYCHRWLARLHGRAPEALALYRRRVNPLATRWLTEARTERDEALLERLVDELFVSESGDDAALVLGEYALERGDYAAARELWERISPQFRMPAPAHSRRATGSGSQWLAVRESADLDENWPALRTQITGSTVNRLRGLSYPDSDQELAGVRARLVLVSILEGNYARAEQELNLLKRLVPTTAGRLAGRQGPYAETLSALLEQANAWPESHGDSNATLAGNPARNQMPSGGIDIGMKSSWRAALAPVVGKNDVIGFGRQRISEGTKNVLAYHPSVWNGIAFVNEHDRLRAIRVATGKPAWPRANRTGDVVLHLTDTRPEFLRPPRRHVGVLRGTVTISDNRLFAKMGSAITTPVSAEDATQRLGMIVGLDLRAQGRLLRGFPLQPESSAWMFEGTPVVDRGRLYVIVRRQDDVRAQCHVACYSIDNARLLWRRLVVASESTGLNRWPELSHRLLTLREGTLFVNTNQGVIAGLRARDGIVKWIVKYPRAAYEAGNPQVTKGNFFRDLTPCLYYRGLVIAAPADSRRLLGIEAATGQVVWTSSLEHLTDAVHLLGVVDDQLFLSGNRLYRVDVFSGRMLSQFPEGNATNHSTTGPRGFGRGVVTRNSVFFPTRHRIYQLAIPQKGRSPWQLERTIDLRPRQASGGHLCLTKTHLLIASPRELIAFKNRDASTQPRKTADASR